LSEEKKTYFTITVDEHSMITNVDICTDGYGSLSEIIGDSFNDYLLGEYEDEIISACSGLNKAEGFNTNILFGPIDNRYLYLAIEVACGGDCCTISFSEATDINAPQITAGSDELVELTAKMQGLFYRTDRFGYLIYLEKGAINILGYSSDILIGSNLRRDIFGDPNTYDDVKSTAILTSGLNDVDIPLKHIDSRIVWVRINSVAITDKNGLYAGTAGFVKNITEHKQNMDEFQALSGAEPTLYHARISEVGDMVGSITHQWRQPLSALMFIIEDIRDAYHFSELDVQYLGDAIDECKSYIRFMSDTMDDFSNFFRYEPDKVEFQLMDKLKEVVRMQCGRLELSAIDVRIQYNLAEAGVELDDFIIIECGKGTKVFKQEIDIAADLVAYGYPNLFKQVVINLINNSIDSVIDSRIRGKMKASDVGLIDICVRVSGELITLLFKDNGLGIDAENLERVFEARYTTKPKNQGTGIGLHMARSIVEKSLGGKIKAKSSDSGALLVIELPRVVVK